jgi:hypothetical protein
MQNEENTDGVIVETQDNETVEVEETPTDETTEESQGDETVETDKSELAKAQAEAAKYRRLFEKTQAKSKVATPAKPQTKTSPTVDVDERILKANGMSDELLTQLRKIASLNGTSLIDAQNDPIFVAVKEKAEKVKKQKEASLPASRGSGGVSSKKDLNTPGLSREEHQALVKERMGL